MGGRKKVTHLDEEVIPINSKVVYCFTPFEKPDDDNKFVFKCGKSRLFGKRLEMFHTDYVNGVILLRVLRFTDANLKESKIGNWEVFLTNVEEMLFKCLKEQKAKRIRSQTRVIERNADGGRTEWFYGNERSIASAFNKVFKEYGGIMHRFKYQTPEFDKDYVNRKEKGFSGEYIVDLKFM